MSQWDLGSYERIARLLQPAADLAVAGIQPEERVLDLCCGSGNAAAAADRVGAEVTGLDISPRLVDVASRRVPGARFVVGDATATPFPDDAFGRVVSVFGVIFADGREASRELLRVTRPGGRIVLAIWPGHGTLLNAGGIVGAAVAEAQPSPQAEPETAWHDPSVLHALFAPAAVTVRACELVLRADSAQQLADTYFDHQPMWLAARDVVGERRYEELRAESARFYESVNEARSGWRATQPYLMATVSA